MRDLNSWLRGSSLRLNWYSFAVKLLDMNKADVIRAKYFQGGNPACLQKMLTHWYKSTTSTDRSWQVIIDALTKMDQFPVIESIEKDCLTW